MLLQVPASGDVLFHSVTCWRVATHLGVLDDSLTSECTTNSPEVAVPAVGQLFTEAVACISTIKAAFNSANACYGRQGGSMYSIYGFSYQIV